MRDVPILSSITAVIISFYLVSQLSKGNALPLIIPESLIVTIRPEQVPKCIMFLTLTLISVRILAEIFAFRGSFKEILIFLGINCAGSIFLLQFGNGEIFSFPEGSVDIWSSGFHFGVLLSAWGVLSNQIDRIDIPWPTINLFSQQDYLEERQRNVNREFEIQNRGDSLLSDPVQELLQSETQNGSSEEVGEIEEFTKPKTRLEILLERMEESE